MTLRSDVYPPWTTTEVDLPTTRAHEPFPSCHVTYTPVTSSVMPTEVMREGSRWYTWEDEFFPSATTVLKHTDPVGSKALHEWKAAVGDDAASAITQRALARGMQWHSFCERYLTNQPVWRTLTQPGNVAYATDVAHLLNERIDTVVASELPVISRAYGVAGRVDVCARLRDGRLAIVDFKTGRKQKSGQRLENYAIQTTFYADAMTGVLGEPVETIVIVQLCPRQLVWQENSAAAWSPWATHRVALFAEYISNMMEPETITPAT